MLVDSLNEKATTTVLNELYGHAEVLRRYVDVADRRCLVVGQLQHGWSPGHAHIEDEDLKVQPLYVWSSRDQRVCEAKGLKNIVPIGSPFLYLPQHDDLPRHVPRSVLALPGHSTPGHPFQSRYEAMEDYATHLDALRKAEGLEQVTVCLHVNDYDDIVAVRVFRRHGMIITTVGSWYGTPAFLMNLRGLILAHDAITSSVLCTPLFYAAWHKKVAFVGGPVPAREKIAAIAETYHPETGDHEWIRKHYPEFLKGLDGIPAYEVAFLELGAEHKRTKLGLWETVKFAFLQRA